MTETFVGSQHYSVQVAALDQEQQGLSSSSNSGILQSRLKEHIRNADKQYSTFLKRGTVKKLIGVILALSIGCIAQLQPGLPLKYNFGGPLAGYPLLSPVGGEPIINFMVGGGKFWQGPLSGTAPVQPFGFVGQPHTIKFTTGTLLSQTPDHVQFAAGGSFHLLSGTISFLFCGTVETNQACTYDGHWVGAGPALDRTVLSDGTYIYTFHGELIGTYFDPWTGWRYKVRAFYQQPSLDQTNPLLEGQQAWGAGTLQVILQAQ